VGDGLREGLLGEGHAVGEHVERTFAGGQFLEPLDLRLGERSPPFERRADFARQPLRDRAAGVDPLVEHGALGEQIGTLLVHHVMLLPGRVETARGGAIE